MTRQVLGYQVAAMTLEQVTQWALQAIRDLRPKVLVTLNPEIIVSAKTNPGLENALQAADLTVADGIGVVWASKRLNQPLPERVPGVDLTMRILESGGPSLRVFFLGAKPGIAQKAADEAQRRYGTLIAGTYHGYFKRPEEVPMVVNRVRDSRAHLLLAGLGEGQELFLHQYRSDLNTPLMIGVGGTLDVLSGKVKRTPPWIRRMGLEWAYRVGLDRKRWHRFPRLLKFVRLVLEES
jgi:N-acetylglucosaminyldiphosphoundecaprenol N-acetyl-beta-D-mannosaminyltransferase